MAENNEGFKVIDFIIYATKLRKEVNKKDYFEYVLNDFFLKTKEGQKPSIEDYFDYTLFTFLIKTEDGQKLSKDDFHPYLREKYYDIVKTKIDREIRDMLNNFNFFKL